MLAVEDLVKQFEHFVEVSHKKEWRVTERDISFIVPFSKQRNFPLIFHKMVLLMAAEA